jgi:hypothetical protein
MSPSVLCIMYITSYCSAVGNLCSATSVNSKDFQWEVLCKFCVIYFVFAKKLSAYVCKVEDKAKRPRQVPTLEMKLKITANLEASNQTVSTWCEQRILLTPAAYLVLYMMDQKVIIKTFFTLLVVLILTVERHYLTNY